MALKVHKLPHIRLEGLWYVIRGTIRNSVYPQGHRRGRCPRDSNYPNADLSPRYICCHFLLQLQFLFLPSSRDSEYAMISILNSFSRFFFSVVVNQFPIIFILHFI